MRTSDAEVRQQVEHVVAAAERAVAARPAAAWPRECLAVCQQLRALAQANAPDPAAADALAGRVDARWRAHDALLSFQLVSAARGVALMHRCRRCGYDCRASPDRCPECGHTAADDTPSPPSAARVRLGGRLQAVGRAAVVGGGLVVYEVIAHPWWSTRGPATALAGVVLVAVGATVATTGTALLRRRA